MDLIILNDGTYYLLEVTKSLMADIKLYNTEQLDFFDLCDILRLKLTTYMDYPINAHVMKDGSGDFYGCIMR
jgi:hypothetical protein|tara:strand:+ start:337 stop:552 length:216 start_codon:yes stop_codon:yes gene_type:complete